MSDNGIFDNSASDKLRNRCSYGVLCRLPWRDTFGFTTSATSNDNDRQKGCKKSYTN